MLSVGNRSTESAANPATTRATVVKKPKTACRRLREECIAAGNTFVVRESPIDWRCTNKGGDEASWACLGLIGGLR